MRFDPVMSTDTPASVGRRQPGGRPSTRIFISYRTGDEPFGAALIDTALSARFGPEAVFRAPRSIRPGEDFAHAILTAVEQSSVLLAVIGPRWLDAAGVHGRPRLHSPADWVRREILHAFHNRVRVVPVLLHANLPKEHELPPVIAQLSSHQYLRLHHRYAPADLERLVDEVDELLGGLPE
ncbi:toll/interleukin-1 receptor domain-containing protein [Streptomyces anthocyanicus]|uniref:toll/interleukin-1 receptor domain-containing protein n=1 Tax=Streptomyces anthocyanicus TaxID=68174 RepID=UPI0033B179A3